MRYNDALTALRWAAFTALAMTACDSYTAHDCDDSKRILERTVQGLSEALNECMARGRIDTE